MSTRRRPSLTIAAWLVVAALAASAAPPVAAHAPDPLVGGELFAQDQRVEFTWRTGSVPPTDIATAIRAAAADANASRASRAATFAFDAEGPSRIGYGAGATCGVNGIACFDRSAAPASFTMWLREHGRSFDWGTLVWCQLDDEATSGCYDAETIALDEFGHVEGLGHHANFGDGSDYLDAVVQTISRTKPRSGWDMHVFGRCDVATLQREYDVATSSSPISTCLDLDTGLTLRSSAASATFGRSVTMTATLKVIDRDVYGRLGGNWLSQRVVKLQRRAVGATTWSTIATMAHTGTAGTYSASATVSGTFDYRAVYSTPSGEGLNGDTSPTVRVTMSGCGTSACPQTQPADER